MAQQDLTRPLAYSEGIHYMHTNPKGTQQIMKKFFKRRRQIDRRGISGSRAQSRTEIPYPTMSGLRTLMNFMTATTPEVANAKPEQFIETHFIKELEDSGFYSRLYR